MTDFNRPIPTETPYYQTLCKRLVAGLALSLLLGSLYVAPVQAREPLRGGASIFVRPFADDSTASITGGVTQGKLGRPWTPSRTRTLVRAEQWVDEYALNAAEKEFRAMLRRDPKYAPAYNGLGMISWYRTTSSNQNLRDKTAELNSDAIQHFLSALRFQPGYVEARLNLGSVYFAQGRYGEAQEEFTRSFLLAPNNAAVLEKMGMSLAQAGRTHEALPYLEKSARLHPGNASVQYWLAKAQFEQGQFNLAHQSLQDALHFNPESAPAHHLLGRLYEEQANGAAAIAEYKRALTIKPEYPEPALALARHYEIRGDYSQSMEVLKSLYESHSDNTELIYRIADLAMRNQQPDVAVKYYEHQLFYQPDDARAKAGISHAHAEMARHEMAFNDLSGEAEALESAEKALVYQPDNYKARFIQVKLDGAHGPLGKKPMSSGEMDAVLYQTPVAKDISVQQAEVLLWRFQFAQAEQQYRVLLNATQSPADSLALGELLLEVGMPGLAQDAFHKTLARDPNSKGATLGLQKLQAQYDTSNRLVEEASLFKSKRKYEQAIHLLDEALHNNLRNMQAHTMLSQIYEARRDYAQAADHVYAGLQLEPGPEQRLRMEKHLARLKEQMRLSQN